LEKRERDSHSMTAQVTRRAATEQDEAFLFALFRDVRAAEFAQAPLGPAQLDLLMSIQYAGQKQTYGAQYPAGNEIVLLDGKPIGRMWLYRGTGEQHLVDISLMADFRNRGIGAALVTEAIAAARAAGVRLCCSVAAANQGSLRFHQRMGFEIAGRDEMYYDLAVEP
jgi:ribosomal protein S18 acetylase RimI-like enzyme